jgi:hypothetical protein
MMDDLVCDTLLGVAEGRGDRIDVMRGIIKQRTKGLAKKPPLMGEAK